MGKGFSRIVPWSLEVGLDFECVLTMSFCYEQAVMTTFGFHFIYALTLIHTLFTLVGMQLFRQMRIYEVKQLPKRAIIPLAGAYVGYIVLNNLNLQLNTVSFYQITKIVVAPAVLISEAVFFGKTATRKVRFQSML